jgi:hypothetical protein
MNSRPTSPRSLGPREAPASQVAAVTLQFHPDWPFQAGTVIEAMAADGFYRSQFVTGVSNGGLTAYRGGDRWLWESRLFAGRYDDGPPADRPVYGGWNRHASAYGAAFRFGSSYVRLRPEAVRRTTFCFPDSVFEPEDFGDVATLPRLCRMADEADTDDLDDYIEAQVHGPVRFDTDVEALVLDPCFADTAVETTARTLGCPIEFHPGFLATSDSVDATYRGPDIAQLAHSLGPDLTPAVIGGAARSHPPQSIKYLWHCLAHFGRAT